MRRAHAMPFGAEVAPDGSVEFRLWAPGAERVELSFKDDTSLPMLSGSEGWYALRPRAARPGTRYLFVVDGVAVPDPASRFQPEDVHGWSEVIDPGRYAWRDGEWRGRPWHEAVLYELHLGTFTREGTYAGAARKLGRLASLGVTGIELMPLAEAPGKRNWGYDGVLPFAPEHRYGRPEELKELIDAAHAHRIMVFLDVVYNHFGPEGNYLHRYAPQFFTKCHRTPWGAAIDFEGSRIVRDFFVHNALYWLEEFHFDGLRLDAVHTICDTGAPHILEELANAVRAALPQRRIHLVLENDDNAARYLDRDSRGRPRHYTAQWNDDLHHALHVLLTGETRGYYGDYATAPYRLLGRTLAEGFAYQGEHSRHRGTTRGAPSRHLPPTAFVSFLQNHDQIGNRAMGERITRLARPAAIRAAASIILLSPMPPLLFMGEEWGASQPFPFFCDFGPDLADAVREGRRREFAQFPEFADPGSLERIPDPLAFETFESAKLDWRALQEPGHGDMLAFYRELLRIRHSDIIPRLSGLEGGRSGWTVHQGGVVDVRWPLADGAVLRAVLSLANAARDGIAIEPEGRLLYSSEPSAAAASVIHGVPPWFVAWFLAEPRRRP